jgi:sec-independent protein translocase protein TatC
VTDQYADDDALAGGRMTIWEHLAELRSRIIKVAIAIAVGSVVAWILYDAILGFLIVPYKALNPDAALYATSPLTGFALRLKVSAYGGVVLAMPVILWQLWRFVTPGLYPHERRYAVPFVASSLVLFIFGAAIAYLTLNPALQFLISVGGSDLRQIYSPDEYFTLILYMMLAFGAGFEFPVLLVALQMVHVLTPRQLLGWWRYAVVVIAIVAAVITPSADPISMMALAVPMFLFYFAAIGIGWLLVGRKRKTAT